MKIKHQSSWEIFETMIGDVIGTFRSTTSAVNQKFVQKIWIEASTCHSVSNTKIDMSAISFQITPFYSPMLENFHILQNENEQVPTTLSQMQTFDMSHKSSRNGVVFSNV